jgi:hypothetical protein
MRAYFLNISEEERKSIQEKQRSIYDGYQTMEAKIAKETPLTIEDLALDKEGITVNNEGEVSEYKHTGINSPMKKTCNECGNMYEGEMCECGPAMYTEEQIEESINIKSKKIQVISQINESLEWFKKFNKY